MINYNKVKEAEKLLEESGASYMLCCDNGSGKDRNCVCGSYPALRSFMITAMVELAKNICAKVNKEIALQELTQMSMLAIEKFHNDSQGDKNGR